MGAPQFLPWLRRGLSQGIGAVDDGAADLAPRGTITAVVTLTDSLGTSVDRDRSFDVLGPGDVVGLDPAQVVRQEPPPDAFDVEANYLPFVELVSPDLPWMLTPARPDSEGRLRPWLVLVCVEERDGVVYDDNTAPLPVLRLDAAVVPDELPDLGQSWAWAHVQSLVPVERIESEVESGTGAVVARLVAPRRLRESRRYRAALVPAFDMGSAAGRGEDTSGFAVAGPAWDRSVPGDLVLPVYLSWTFATSAEAGDFEELAKRLEPDTEGGRMGYHEAELVDRGLLPPVGGDTGFEYDGPLVDPGSRPVGLRGRARTWFVGSLPDVLAESAGRQVVPRRTPAGYVPARDDPVLGPPLYGSWAADRYEVPARGWLNQLNLQPARRAAAGLGAEVVRRHQEEFLAAAWDQVGEVIALRQELNRGRLAAEVGRSHGRRIGALDPDSRLQVTRGLHPFVDAGGVPVATRVAESVILPTAIVSAAFIRQARPGCRLARRAGRSRAGRYLGARVTARFVAASVGADQRDAELELLARFGAAFVPTGTITGRTTFAVPTADAVFFVDLEIVQPADPIASSADDDVQALSRTIGDHLDPMPTIVDRLDRRITGVDLDPAADLPTRIVVGPRFPEGLFPRVHAMGSELVLPGIERLGRDRVRLVAVNEAWIAAFLAGANHEWAREALWNEYPADLGATAFSTFWRRIPAGSTDLSGDMHTWPIDATLQSRVGDPDATSTVLLVRGDLIRRHPDTEFMLVTPTTNGTLVTANGTIPAARLTWPSFQGRLDRSTVFVGFDVDPTVVWDEGRYVGLQEPTAGPRFGFDVAHAEHFGSVPATWADSSWGHLAASSERLEELTYVDLADIPWLDGQTLYGVTWGRNSAHLAGAAFQQPFRLLMPAAQLMPDPRGGGSAP